MTAVLALVLGLLALGPLPAAAQGPSRAGAPVPGGDDALLTRAERTDWMETTRYAEALAILEAVAARAEHAHLTTMGYTSEGRPIPMLVLGRVADASPASVRASGLLRVYLQGNIHGGEVPGKEALLMMVRELAERPDHPWFDELVLLVVPIYNVDGNERVRLTNRPRQNGPLGGMGQRPNAQGYDLNRDHMKLDSPEARSVARMLTLWDPQVGVDLHTTNGTRHAYHLTYSPPLHPGTDSGVLSLLRDEAFPRITRRIRDRDGWDFYYYGNARERDGEMGWYTFDHRPRFNNNYLGLRNRVAILSEAYAYATFRDRVLSTRRFVEEILDWAVDREEEIRRVVAEADRSPVGLTLPLRAEPEAAEEPVTILMGAVESFRHPFTGEPVLNRLDVSEPVPMVEYGTFRATESEVVPARYYVPADLEPALDRLAAHGVQVDTLDAARVLEVEEFRVETSVAAAREFQGHRERTVEGRWIPARRTLPPGTRVVELAQPLGRLAFYLLEPRSDDGLVAWGLLDDALPGELPGPYPVVRVR